jgi:hypothetical protein
VGKARSEHDELQRVLRHAERFAALLFVHELTPPFGDDEAARWLFGRAAEVERYAESVMDDRAEGVIDERGAIASLQQYLDAMHAGLTTVVGAAAPSCCHPPAPGRHRRRRS